MLAGSTGWRARWVTKIRGSRRRPWRLINGRSRWRHWRLILASAVVGCAGGRTSRIRLREVRSTGRRSLGMSVLIVSIVT